MKRRQPRRSLLLPFLAGLFAACVVAQPARAQWGMGWGMFGGFNTVPSPTGFLNDRANIQASRGMQARPSHSPYSGNSNAYFNRVRDNGLVPHYDVSSGMFPAYGSVPPPRSPGLTSNAPRAPKPTASPAPAERPKPTLPLLSFFDAAERLVWPSEAPVGGELKPKRDASDEASVAVLRETKQQKLASITSVTEARQRLLDYGRPALQEIRRDQTPRIADTFHLFLLSLYESLAQAAVEQPAQP